jgi:hypothetical protein
VTPADRGRSQGDARASRAAPAGHRAQQNRWLEADQRACTLTGTTPFECPAAWSRGGTV